MLNACIYFCSIQAFKDLDALIDKVIVQENNVDSLIFCCIYIVLSVLRYGSNGKCDFPFHISFRLWCTLYVLFVHQENTFLLPQAKDMVGLVNKFAAKIEEKKGSLSEDEVSYYLINL